jgi:DNA-binding transcriptional LysR family regulator
VNNPTMQVLFARRGFGIVRLPEEFVLRQAGEHELVKVLTSWHPAGVPLHALTTARAVPARVRLFIDYLVAKFNRDTVGLHARR